MQVGDSFRAPLEVVPLREGPQRCAGPRGLLPPYLQQGWAGLSAVVQAGLWLPAAGAAPPGPGMEGARAGDEGGWSWLAGGGLWSPLCGLLCAAAALGVMAVVVTASPRQLSQLVRARCFPLACAPKAEPSPATVPRA